jgi:membrane associated rhomboid family serine protease
VFIIPIRKDGPVRHTSWVIYALIVANITVFAATSILSSGEGIALRYGFIPARHELTTVFTSMFLHGDILHILGNMFFLWMFGESVEEAVGHILTAIGYLACGILATALFYLAQPHSTIPCIGASGAISGMMGMYMLLFPRAKMDLMVYVWRFHVRTISTNSVGAVGAWLGEQTLLGVFSSTTGLTFGIGLALTRSGFPSHYQRIVERKAARFMICPSCGQRGRRKPAVSYTCRRCGTKLRVDEAGLVGLVEPSKTQPPTWITRSIVLESQPPTWIVLAIVLVMLGWTARVVYNFCSH